VGGFGIHAEGPVSAAAARVQRVVSAVFGARPSVDPMPPHGGRAVPWTGAGRALTRDPTAFFIRCRKRFEDLTLLSHEVPIEISDEHQTYRLAPGTLVATMLSVTNRFAAAGLQQFNVDNYRGATFVRADELPARELVTTYGHGKHSCPAHRFSTLAIRHATCELVRRFELNPLFEEPLPLRRQIGGVARADRACEVSYRARGRATNRRSEIVPKSADRTTAAARKHTADYGSD